MGAFGKWLEASIKRLVWFWTENGIKIILGLILFYLEYTRSDFGDFGLN